jgi:hypothetical protein
MELQVTIESMTSTRTIDADPMELEIVLQRGTRQFRAFLLGFVEGWRVAVRKASGALVAQSAGPTPTLDEAITYAEDTVRHAPLDEDDWLPRCAA